MATAPAPKIKDQFDDTTVIIQDIGMVLFGVSGTISIMVLFEAVNTAKTKKLHLISGLAIILGIILVLTSLKRRNAIRAKEQAALEAMTSPKN